MKIYTRTGDDGATGLFRGGRVSKDAARIEAYGGVDELNAVLGLLRAEPLGALEPLVAQIQHQLFDLGAELATPGLPSAEVTARRHAQAAELETAIDYWEDTLEPLTQFILPAGCRAACLAHLARTVCRRAERSLVRLRNSPGEEVSGATLAYLNRLSDLLFVAARALNAQADTSDVAWEKPE